MSTVQFKNPVSVGEYSNNAIVNRVDYSDRNLKTLPDDFDESNPHLSILVLDNNNLASLPEGVLSHPGITILSVTNNENFVFSLVQPLPPNLASLSAEGVKFEVLPRALLEKLQDSYFGFYYSVNLFSNHAKAQITPISCLKFLQHQGGYVLKHLEQNDNLLTLVRGLAEDVNALENQPMDVCQQIVTAVNQIVHDYPFELSLNDLVQDPAGAIEALENRVIQHDKEQDLAARRSPEAKKKDLRRVHFREPSKPQLSDKQQAIAQILSHASQETMLSMLSDANNLKDFLRGIGFTFVEIFNHVNFDELNEAAPWKVIIWAAEILDNPHVQEILSRTSVLDLKKLSCETAHIKCYRISDDALSFCPKLEIIRLGPETLLDLSPIAATKYQVYKTYVRGGTPTKCHISEYSNSGSMRSRRNYG